MVVDRPLFTSAANVQQQLKLLQFKVPCGHDSETDCGGHDFFYLAKIHGKVVIGEHAMMLQGPGVNILANSQKFTTCAPLNFFVYGPISKI